MSTSERTRLPAAALPPLLVPHDCLPDDDALRAAWLRKLFPDHAVTSTRGRHGWSVSLCWPERPEHYVDPALADGLRWWACDAGVEDIPFAVRQEPGLQVSLSDAWTLHAWSGWLARLAREGATPPAALLLHVDEHDDLRSPHLWTNDGEWMDALTGQPVALLDPPSVAAAIRSGAIGISSFIVPLLHHLPGLAIRHLRPSRPAGPPARYRLRPAVLADPALGPRARRLAVRPEPDGPGSETLPSYAVSSDPAAWLCDLPPGPVFLHIDLDGFNNRFDGDSAWALREARYDPPQALIEAGIDSVFAALAAHEAASRIVDVSVALSPGFFPAEHWASATERVRRNLAALCPPGSHGTFPASWSPHA